MSKTKIDPKKPLSLEQFAASDAGERFNLALEEALANALDPNRPIKSVRAVTLTVSIVPIQPKNDAQLVPNSANMTVGVSVKLAGLKSLAMPVHFGRKEGTGEPVAVVIDPAQHEIFAAPKSDDDENIIPIGAAEGGNA